MTAAAAAALDGGSFHRLRLAVRSGSRGVAMMRVAMSKGRAIRVDLAGGEKTLLFVGRSTLPGPAWVEPPIGWVLGSSAACVVAWRRRGGSSRGEVCAIFGSHASGIHVYLLRRRRPHRRVWARHGVGQKALQCEVMMIDRAVMEKETVTVMSRDNSAYLQLCCRIGLVRT